MTDLPYLTATEALARFRARELSPVELMTAVIERAGAVEPVINAFAATRYDEALEAARAAEARYAGSGTGSGPPPRPLEGLPVAVKEEAPIAGQLNTLGSLPLRDVVADHTAAFAQRILDAGGIVHARTTTPEFSCAPVTWSKLWGVTRNPWQTAYSPGGSSGGSAAALAAGTTTLATGSDIGGSIRIPSSFCGVTGFKPPYGRVPEVEIFNLDHYCHEGPLARTVADCALLENVIAGPHPHDVASLRPKLEIPAQLDPVAGLRIALSADLGCYEVDADVAASTSAAADRLRDAGAVVEEVALPWQLADINRAARIHFGLIFGPSIQEIYEQHEADLTSYAQRFYKEGLEIRKEDFVAGLALEAQIYAPLGELLDDYDALVCPTFAVPALPAEYDNGSAVQINGQTYDDWLDVLMTVPFNIASRCPVMSVPSGLSRDGVPTGLSIVGRSYDDVTVFRIAAAHEERYGWYGTPDRRPSLMADQATTGRPPPADGRRPAVPGPGAGHAGELAGPAVQCLGLPAHPRAHPHRPDRPGQRPGPAAPRRAGPVRAGLPQRGPRLDGRGRPGRQPHRRVPRPAPRPGRGRALRQRDDPGHPAPADVGVQVGDRRGGRGPGRPRPARPGRAGQQHRARAGGHVVRGRDRPAPAGHAGRH